MNEPLGARRRTARRAAGRSAIAACTTAMACSRPCAGEHGQLRWFDRHLARLALGCERLRARAARCRAAAGGGRARVAQRIAAGARQDHPDARCGDGARLPAVAATSARRASSAPTTGRRRRRRNFAPALSAVRLGVNPQLAGIKHLNRLEQVLAQRAAARHGLHEVLMRIQRRRRSCLRQHEQPVRLAGPGAADPAGRAIAASPESCARWCSRPRRRSVFRCGSRRSRSRNWPPSNRCSSPMCGSGHSRYTGTRIAGCSSMRARRACRIGSMPHQRKSGRVLVVVAAVLAVAAARALPPARQPAWSSAPRRQPARACRCTRREPAGRAGRAGARAGRAGTAPRRMVPAPARRTAARPGRHLRTRARRHGAADAGPAGCRPRRDVAGDHRRGLDLRADARGARRFSGPRPRLAARATRSRHDGCARAPR